MVREKRIGVGGAEMVVRLDDQRAEMITGRRLYRRFVGPALRRLERPVNGHQVATNGYRTAPSGEIPVYYPRPEHLPQDTPEQREISARVAAHTGWYHTIELGHGVRTPGQFDHDPVLRYYPLPDSLAGKRCLDVATLDGYWAFEMERRGAAEVLALDIESWLDWDMSPQQRDYFRQQGGETAMGRGFAIAAELLGSRVQRRICNVYDLTPERFGTFDFVFCGDLLIHLANPMRAIQNIYAVTRDGGTAVFVDPFTPALEGAGYEALARLMGAMHEIRWWEFSRSFYEKAIRLGGFDRVEFSDPVDLRIRVNADFPLPRAIARAFRDGTSAGEGA